MGRKPKDPTGIIKTPCVYQIINLVNNSRYVGSTKNFMRRKSDHLSALRKDKHWNKELQVDFNETGESCFKFVRLVHSDVTMIKLFENRLIQSTVDNNKKCYNQIRGLCVPRVIEGGAECPECGYKFKNEMSAKGGKKSKRAISPEAQAKMQAARKLKGVVKK